MRCSTRAGRWWREGGGGMLCRALSYQKRPRNIKREMQKRPRDTTICPREYYSAWWRGGGGGMFCRALQKRPRNIKRDLQKRPRDTSRDPQKRPAKETCKRDLQKSPAEETKGLWVSAACGVEHRQRVHETSKEICKRDHETSKETCKRDHETSKENGKRDLQKLPLACRS